MEIIKYNEILKRKKNLLSLSIFKIIGPYRSFEKYTRFLDRILTHTYQNEFGFDTRVYFDDSCFKEIEPFFSKYKNVEFYKFNYPPLRIGDFHDGTFGSIIRLLPIFEINNLTDGEHVYEYIWVDDIDILPMNLDLGLIYTVNNELNKKFNFNNFNNFNTLFLSLFCYQRPWVKNNYNMNFPLVTNIKLDKNIFLEFLNDIVNRKFKDVVKNVLKFRPDRYIYDYDVRFPYGMDEYFTNFIIYDQLTSFNTYVIYQTDISKLFKRILINIKIDKYNIDLIKNLLKLHEISYKTEKINIKRDINNTYIKLFNKIDKQKLYKEISDYDINCFSQFINFLKKYDFKDINNFKTIINFSANIK